MKSEEIDTLKQLLRSSDPECRTLGLALVDIIFDCNFIIWFDPYSFSFKDTKPPIFKHYETVAKDELSLWSNPKCNYDIFISIFNIILKHNNI